MEFNNYEDKFYIKVKEINNFNDEQKIIKAYLFAKKAHTSQKRKSGLDYITHPLAVGISLRDKFKNVDLFISGLLHDTVEDCEEVNMQYIYDNFGLNIGYIVDSVTKTEQTFFGKNTIFSDEREKILHGGLQNIGVILLKLADREHNLATLGFMPKNKQIKKSFESQALYLPLINILEFKSNNYSLDEVNNKLQTFLVKNNIKTVKQFKNNLLNTCFHDFSEDIFDIIYNNSNQVVWEITDKVLFDTLLESGWFDADSVEIQQIEIDGEGKFKVIFAFTSGSTFDFSRGKIAVSDSRFIG